MTVECPKCKSPVAREGQRFCYRCGHELGAYYESLKRGGNPSGASDPLRGDASSPESPEAIPPAPKIPVGTVVLEPHAFDTTIETPPPTPQKASLKILLPTGDVFDRQLTNAEIQIGKGPRNDIVIADPAVSTAHAMVRLEGSVYTINDIGSRNGTFVNGERVAESRQLNHGDVIGIGLSKLTFRMGDDYSETGAIDLEELAAASSPPVPAPLTEESLALAAVSAGLATKADVDRVRSDAKGRRVYRALIEERLASEESLRDLMSKTFQMPLIDLSTSQIDEAVVAEFPARLAREHQVFPVAKEADSLILAVADPTDTGAVEQLRREVRSPLSIRLATATQIRERVDLHYGPRLIGVLPSGEKLEYLIDKQEVEIGKAGHNHITLTDPTVSNTHAIVTARDAGYTIVDLGSRNGTFVNGERLGSQAHTLRHGDKVQLGKTVLTFRNPGETTANMTAVLSREDLEEVRRRAKVTDTTPEKERRTAEPVSPERPPAVQAPPTGAPGSGSAPEGLAPAPSGPEAGAAVEAAAGDDKDEKKKKKKKKKKDKDARLKAAYVSAWGRIFAAVLSVALTVALTLYLTRSSSAPIKEEVKISKKGHAKLKLPKPTGGTPFQGGPFESSGVVQVPGSSAVLFVDDAKLDEIIWMQIDESGKQTGTVKPIPLGASVADLEGITYGEGYFYVIGSQSDPKDGEQNAIARFKFDVTSQTIRETEVIPNLRDFLVTNVPELKEEGAKSGKDGGLNIEGLGWDPKRNRLLLGLRSPQLNGNALIVPIALSNLGGPFSIGNIKVVDGHAIQLPLEGLGIRDIQYDSHLDSFLIIAGAPEHHDKKLGFKLWQWNGDPAASDSDALHALTDLETAMKPEGITHFEFGGKDFIFIVGDAGTYTKLDYTETE
jgi:pSer/pThr/pTyr-binding forkhead associated (FHA) protein